MTIDIIGINAVPGGIVFEVSTDAGGCDEDFSTTINGKRFAAHLTLVGAGPHNGSISTNPTTGACIVTVTAETSKVSSGATWVVLVAAGAAGGSAGQ